VDASGQRVRLARRAVHLGIGVCVLALAAATFSLLGNVPLPGLRPPATLPGNSHASKHSPTLAREPVAGSSTQPAQATVLAPGVSSGSRSAGAASSVSASTRAPTSSSHGKPTTTPSVAPTASATSSSRSHGPPPTPPGKTKPPHT
jgi:hypothetical protein